MQILSSQQIHEADAFTISHEPITSIDLMERAAKKFYDILISKFSSKSQFVILCGKGNNGGDGLAIARMLCNSGYNVSVFIINYTHNASDDFLQNYERLLQVSFENCSINEISDFQKIPIDANAIIIDGIFGSGLNRPISNFTANIISYINSLPNLKIAIDIPSGLYADKPIETNDIVFKADETITFQAPKFQFLFAENSQFTGNVTIADINLLSPFPDNDISDFFTSHITLPSRDNFSHKGTFGHALLVSGCYGKMGAAILASKACLRSGCGLLTTHIPYRGYQVMQTAFPETMVSIDQNPEYISSIPNDEKYAAIGIGPGIGTNETTTQAIAQFLKDNKKPLVIDADALNILASNQDLLQYINANTILTPHPGEFDRLTHKHFSGFERFKSQKQFAIEHHCIVILKGHYTSIVLPNGKAYFNSTGNAGMATAGSGDVLTGIITSLLAQGYSPEDAAICGVFLHGRAGDFALENNSMETLVASDIISNLWKAFKKNV